MRNELFSWLAFASVFYNRPTTTKSSIGTFDHGHQLTVNESLHVLLAQCVIVFRLSIKVSGFNCICFELPKGKTAH